MNLKIWWAFIAGIIAGALLATVGGWYKLSILYFFGGP